jgi:peptidyl-prolyl cis-trans isomerase C
MSFGGYRLHSISDQLDLPIETRGGMQDALLLTEAPPRVGAMRSRTSTLLRRLLNEPLLHFLLAGAVLFGLGTLFDRASNASASQMRIQVSAPEIQRLRELWTRQWGHTPDSDQMKNLIDEHVREEILYREALASGLDKDDTIIRRRLVEKMEFLSQEVAADEPSEQDLQAYFQQNRKKFQIPAQISFSHIYFSTSRRGRAAESDAGHALVGLESGRISSAQFSTLGDPFMLQNEYPLQSEQQIRELFGEEFVRKLFQFEAGAWAGPIRSGYGFHLVHIEQKVRARLPELAEVRSQVLTDFKNQRLQTASEALYSRLRKRYRVEVDEAALAAAASQPPTASKPVSQDGMSGDVD